MSKEKEKNKAKTSGKHGKKIKQKKKIIVQRSYVKKSIITDANQPTGVKANPFVVKNRLISKRVGSIIIGIQQPIVRMLDLRPNTWFKQYCDPTTKTIFLEVYNKNNE